MPNYKKAGLLSVLIALPLFILLFLYAFNSNEYNIEVFFPDGIRNETPGVPHRVDDFSLLNQDSVVYNFSPELGKVYVVDFIFTRCGSFCPLLTNQFIRVQDKYGEEERVKLLSFTVDPEFDSPYILKNYAERYGVEGNQWQFLTGEKKTIYSLINEQFLLPVAEESEGEHDFIHSDRIVLLDEKGQIRGFYEGQNKDEIDRLLVEIGILLRQYDKR